MNFCDVSPQYKHFEKNHFNLLVQIENTMFSLNQPVSLLLDICDNFTTQYLAVILPHY